MSRLPWYWLGIAGGVLILATVVVITQLGGASPDSRYEPASVVDGEMKPGSFAD